MFRNECSWLPKEVMPCDFDLWTSCQRHDGGIGCQDVCSFSLMSRENFDNICRKFMVQGSYLILLFLPSLKLGSSTISIMRTSICQPMFLVFTLEFGSSTFLGCDYVDC